ncbi:MAG: adenosine kinase [Candidatus Pseudothioglobus sp.]|jgi:adenosine kinase
MSTVMVCGSVALDMIGQYPGCFEEYQSKHPVMALNISLQLTELRTSFGGCGMNIAYGLHQLGICALPVSVVGRNFDDHYGPHLKSLGIDTQHVTVDPDYAQCATGVMISDEGGNQITVFHAGAGLSPRRPLPHTLTGIEHVEMAVLAPEHPAIMRRQAEDFAALDIPILFDPGQCLHEFNAADLQQLISLSRYITVNDHEWGMLQRISGMTPAQLVGPARQIVVTLGDKGVDIYTHDEGTLHIAAIDCATPVDATGCGDAFRAGFVFGLLRGAGPEAAARMGSLAAVYNLEHEETQCYAFTPTSFAERYLAEFGHDLAHQLSSA